MKIDISRDTFDPSKHYSRVLMQQGRVQLDADWNEQVEIQLRQLRALAEDLGGPSWGPGNAFRVWVSEPQGDIYTLSQTPGRYYVRGILCDHSAPPPDTSGTPTTDETGTQRLSRYLEPSPIATVTSTGYKPQGADAEKKWETATGLLVLLAVRERVVTALENPLLAEVALGGPDTAARTEVVSEVVLRLADGRVTKETAVYFKVAADLFQDLLAGGDPAAKRGTLNVGTYVPTDTTNPCQPQADSRFTGLENQLFRVEIRIAGVGTKAGFVWAADNAYLVAPLLSIKDSTVGIGGVVEGRSGFQAGDWVELTDDEREGNGGGFFFMIGDPVEGALPLITKAPDGTIKQVPKFTDFETNPKVRRWGSDITPVNETWQPLVNGNGVRILFDHGEYRSGDYWLIPARPILGDVQWPGENQDKPAPKPQPPRHAKSYEAPLAFVEKPGTGTNPPPAVVDLRRALPTPMRPNVAPVPDGLPSAFAIPAEKFLFRLVAVGVARYRLIKDPAGSTNKWTPDDIVADLFDENGAIVGRHSMTANSTLVWQSFDGSTLTSPEVSSDLPSSKPIPCEVYTVTTLPNKPGMFDKATRVSRLLTVSDPVRNTSDFKVDEKSTLRFLATYCFYTA